MQMFAKFLAVLAIVGFVSFTHAADKGTKAVRGVIVSIDTTALTITLKGKDGPLPPVTYTAKTTVTIDGKDGALTDLKADMRVQITPDAAGVATKIEVKTAPPKKAK